MKNQKLLKNIYFIFGFGTALLLTIGLVSFYANANASTVTVDFDAQTSPNEITTSDTYVVNELPSPQIVVSQTELSNNENFATQNNNIDKATQTLIDRLPHATSEKSVVLDSIKILIEEEDKIIEKQAGWYHISYEYYLPNQNQQTVIQSSDGEHNLQSGEVIPTSPVHESFVHIDPFQNITSSISFLKEKDSGQVTQIAVWDGESSIQVNKRDAGFPIEDWKNDKKPEIPSLNQAQYDNLVHALYEEETLLSAELTGTRYFVHASTKPLDETVIYGVNGSVSEIKITIEFDALTGRLLSSETYAVLTTGESILTSKNVILAQEVIPNLPDEVAALYKQNGFSIK